MANLFERLLVPLSASEGSLAVVRQAAQIARQQQARLLLLFVADTSVRDLLAGIGKRPPEAVQEEQIANGRRYLQHAAALAEKEGVPAEQELRVGLTYSEIVSTAREKGVTLLVVGPPAQQELRGLYQARIVRQIIESACCSVLVLRGG